MEEQNWLAARFEESRPRLTRVAYRMLGSAEEAEDAVQETWLRLSRSDPGAIENLMGWLTTVVARICLDILRSRKARREESLDAERPPQMPDAVAVGADRDAILADSIGPALLVVLEALTPPERVAFVLHDMFGMPFSEIASIVGRTPGAARQLASRARRRVRASVEGPALLDSATERSIVDAFLAAARNADFTALLSLLDPECVLASDEFASLLGSPKRIDGGRNVADFFNGAASAAVRATINGVAAAAWAPNGKVRVAFSFAFRDGRIADIELIADRKRLGQLDVVLLEG